MRSTEIEAGRAAVDADVREGLDPMIRRDPKAWATQSEDFRRGYDARYRTEVMDAFLRGYADTRRFLEDQ